jgi:hypothetical protein
MAIVTKFEQLKKPVEPGCKAVAGYVIMTGTVITANETVAMIVTLAGPTGSHSAASQILL